MSASETGTTYEIAAWSETFETADSRKHKVLGWVSLPIDRQSSGYQSLIDCHGKEAPAIYGAWCALVTIAAECPTRGRLANSKGQPYSIRRIARMAYMPEEVFEKLFEWAIRPENAWLIPVESFESINDRSSIDCQSIANQSTIELPNLTLPNTTLPNTPSNDGGVGAHPDTDDAGDENTGSNTPPPPKGRARKRKPPKDQPRRYAADFIRWWEVYPRQVNKPPAADAFDLALSRLATERGTDREASLAWLIDRTRAFARSVGDRPPDKVPHASTWLNADRWNDPIESGTKGSAVDPGVTYSPEHANEFGRGF